MNYQNVLIYYCVNHCYIFMSESEDDESEDDKSEDDKSEDEK